MYIKHLSFFFTVIHIVLFSYFSSLMYLYFEWCLAEKCCQSHFLWDRCGNKCQEISPNFDKCSDQKLLLNRHWSSSLASTRIWDYLHSAWLLTSWATCCFSLITHLTHRHSQHFHASDFVDQMIHNRRMKTECNSLVLFLVTYWYSLSVVASGASIIGRRTLSGDDSRKNIFSVAFLFLR